MLKGFSYINNYEQHVYSSSVSGIVVDVIVRFTTFCIIQGVSKVILLLNECEFQARFDTCHYGKKKVLFDVMRYLACRPEMG